VEGDTCNFDVEVKNEHRHGSTGPSYVRLVDVKIFGHVYRLHQKKALWVDGNLEEVPYNADDVTIFYSGNVLQFSSPKCDVWVSFDGVSFTTVKVNGKYGGQLSGICGNCNGLKDDYRTKDGRDVSNERGLFNLIGDSFQVDDDSDLPNKKCEPAKPPPDEICTPDDKKEIQIEKRCAIDKAKIPKLQECLASGLINIEEWKKSCEIDLCFNIKDKEKMEQVKCEILKALFDTCAERGFYWNRLAFLF